MKIDTTRFGPVEVDPQRVITMPKGMLGFPLHKQYALIAASEDSPFYWLQALNEPSLAFVVCDPRLFVSEYQIVLKGDDQELLGVIGEDEVTLLVVCNKVDDLLTANLRGPIAVNPTTREGKQLVLSEKRLSTRHPLLKLLSREQEVVSKTA
ncbi:MAG: flagellar assembly protein FliW [Planctomycetes bacterium]|nr:flagellar assembly protein FliW [Planctomycetota bacterium]